MFRHQRWSAGALLGSWIAWWGALVGVSIGPGLLRALRLGREPGMHGSVSASFDSGHLQLIVKNAADAAGSWTFDTSMSTALAWIAIPPLALWLLWLLARPHREALAAHSVALLPDQDVGRAPPSRPNVERVERQS
jgi:hypothetical protein